MLGGQGLCSGFGEPLVASPLPPFAPWSVVWKPDSVLKPSCCCGSAEPSPPPFSLLSLPWVLKTKQLMELLWEKQPAGSSESKTNYLVTQQFHS